MDISSVKGTLALVIFILLGTLFLRCHSKEAQCPAFLRFEGGSKILNSHNEFHQNAISQSETPPNLTTLSTPDENDETLLKLADSCAAEHPKVIFYNRIPKTGSTSVQKYIHDCASQQAGSARFRAVSYQPGNMHGHPDKRPFVPIPSPEEIAYRQAEMLRLSPAVFDAHTYYHPYLPVNAHTSIDRHGDISFVNIMREPLERLSSLYRYHCRKKVDCNLDPNVHLFRMPRNSQTKFLCGTSPECSKSTHEALHVAKNNVAKVYSAVGISSNIAAVTEVWRKIFPSFFQKNFTDVHYNISNITSSLDNLTTQNKEKLLDIHWADYKLYRFTAAFFDRKVAACRLLTK